MQIRGFTTRSVLLAACCAMLSTGDAYAQNVAKTDKPDGPLIEQAVAGDRASGWLKQGRSAAVARHGMVATSQPLAAQAGLEILRQGGNAIDAAIATAAAMNVVEPEAAGIGGDSFAIIWLAKEKKLIAMNSTGRSGSLATREAFKKLKLDRVPLHGPLSVTVPGAVDGWDALLKRAGTMGFQQVLAPAVRLAEEGFPLTERIQADFAQSEKLLLEDAEATRLYLVNGKAPPVNHILRNPDLGKTFRLLQAGGRDAFYKGPIADAIIAKLQSMGGHLIKADLDTTHFRWETPISTNYKGYDIFQLPPNTQGFAALEMLNIVEVCGAQLGVDPSRLGPRSADYWHLMVEAKKLAYADLHKYNGDPDMTPVPTERLISKEYAATLCSSIDMKKARPAPPVETPNNGTVYLTTADSEGNMVSFIYSIFAEFGSGIVVPGYGFVLNDRAAQFTLDTNSPNVIAPKKRVFHTLIPGFIMKDGRPVTSFGLMGGAQQAQGHAQVVVDMVDFGANVQAASDAARFAHSQQRDTLDLESALYDLVGADLAARGHKVRSANGVGMGGYQAIEFVPEVPGTLPGPEKPGGPLNGTYVGGSDHRKDGAAVGW